MLVNEEVCNLKASLAETQRQLREMQLKEMERNCNENTEK